MFTVAKCTISWKAELQDIVILSITEAECMAAVEASKETLWLRGLVETFSVIWIQFGFIATARVRFILLRITCITSGQSTLM